MSMAVVRGMLFWCTLINYGLLVFWAVLTILPHEWLRRLSSRWYHISPEQFDAVNLAGIVFYKVLIIVFNLIPFIALMIVGGD